jgi:hypothetical protein
MYLTRSLSEVCIVKGLQYLSRPIKKSETDKHRHTRSVDSRPLRPRTCVVTVLDEGVGHIPEIVTRQKICAILVLLVHRVVNGLRDPHVGHRIRRVRQRYWWRDVVAPRRQFAAAVPGRLTTHRTYGTSRRWSWRHWGRRTLTLLILLFLGQRNSLKQQYTQRHLTSLAPFPTSPHLIVEVFAQHFLVLLRFVLLHFEQLVVEKRLAPITAKHKR